MKVSNNIALSVMVLMAMTFLGSKVSGQAIHFSNFNQVGTILNPAQTGAYYGTARVGGVYRDQYRKVSGQPYSTTLLYVDAPITFIGKQHKSWLGLGGNAYIDQAGLAALNTLAYNLSAAYHYALDDNYRNVISIAASAGYANRRNDLMNSSLFFENEINNDGSIGGQTSQDRNAFAKNASFADVGVGAMLKYGLSDRANITVGTGVMHLNKPTVSFVSKEYNVPLRFNVHAGVDYAISNQLMVTPSVLFAKLGEAQQVQIQAMAGYQLNPTFLLKGGLGTRLQESVQLFLGAAFNRFDVGVSYDYTLSEISNAATGGALELALSYIFIKETKVASKPKFICPQL